MSRPTAGRPAFRARMERLRIVGRRRNWPFLVPAPRPAHAAPAAAHPATAPARQPATGEA